ncbi:hypothetical protein PSN45_001628 [Yamadazyma tenuis]|uniref:Bromodomain associated domain-containing protein n=1 Tax=Candida tenuis (strain ATCC 10573 / BCRC 21748 / CBS 615 / JCM 9827 / NBRC 10315 / NRRL Y-1498 / VKM Y-70) TaxID=590646 RepID=G3BEV4_CANTC|nr:uncharacterized protein CANTEDRAFT_116679 [Yamadazyma tenuis ATCC 10573]EGV60601.1 hypothetical protein CANTEDRAFT_116679 [Yamadazyma tenuis ATCC 10573]WEJ94149.1 hypothetical protein PSN45_001628 [Yamadazyma tenuis]
MEEDFHFRLLRISIIQLLKSHGFDKSKSSTADVVTDLYVNMLDLLVTKAVRFSNLRNDDMKAIDILQAMLEVGLLKNSDNTKYNTKSVDSFKNWLSSLTFNTSKQVNQVPGNLKKVIIENRNFKDEMNDEEEKLRRLKKKQDFFNSFGQADDNTHADGMGAFDDDEVNIDINWVDYLIEKDSKFSNKKFEDTSLGPTVSTGNGVAGDYLVEASTDHVNQFLPINIKYDDRFEDEVI